MKKPTETTFTAPIPEPAQDVPHAPFVYFEGVSASGFLPGMVTVTLVAGCVLPDAGGSGTRTRPTVVAYLRSNRVAAVALRDALNTALEASEPHVGTVN